MILVVVIHAANIPDSKGAFDVISNIRGRFPGLKKIVADVGYRGAFDREREESIRVGVLEIVLRPDAAKKFTVLPKKMDCGKDVFMVLRALEDSVKIMRYFRKLHKS